METQTDTKNKNRVAGICQQIIFKISRLLYNSIHSQVSATYHFLAMLRLFPTLRWLTYRHWLTSQDFLVSNLLFLVVLLAYTSCSPPFLFLNYIHIIANIIHFVNSFCELFSECIYIVKVIHYNVNYGGDNRVKQ